MQIFLKVSLPKKQCYQCIHFRENERKTYIFNQVGTYEEGIKFLECEKGIYLAGISDTAAFMKFSLCSEFYSRYKNLI